MNTSATLKLPAPAPIRCTDWLQRRELNLDDKQALLEAADDLKSQGNLRLLMEDDTEETWAILMGAKALEKLANSELSNPRR